jgi:hypothetical protein
MLQKGYKKVTLFTRVIFLIFIFKSPKSSSPPSLKLRAGKNVGLIHNRLMLRPGLGKVASLLSAKRASQ